MIKRIIAVLLCLLIASPAWATIASVGVFGKNNENASDTSLVITTTATLEVGNLAIIGIGVDNFNTTDADHDEITNVTDSAGNTWTQICEYTNGQGTAGAGATSAAWMTRATSQLTSGGTITITLANSVSAKAAVAHEFTVGGAVEIDGSCSATASDGLDPPSMTLSGLANVEHLYVRFHAKENSDSDDFNTLTAGYTAFGFAEEVAGGGSAAMNIAGEFIIETSTGQTSNPSALGDNDAVNLMFAIRESAIAFVPMSSIFFQ